MNPDQTAPLGAVWIGFICFASKMKVVWSVFEDMQQMKKKNRHHFQDQKYLQDKG